MHFSSKYATFEFLKIRGIFYRNFLVLDVLFAFFNNFRHTLFTYMKKTSISLKIICISMIIVTSITSFYFAIQKKENNALSPFLPYKIVIDPGHGGVDGGAIGVKTGNKESDLNLDLSFQLQEYLLASDFSVTLTRQTQDGLYGEANEGFKRRDMEKRKEIINSTEPEIVVSIHMNKFPSPSRRGAQVYFQKGDEVSEEFARAVQSELNRKINQPQVRRDFFAQSGDFYICKIKKPAIIIECGFLSNPEDDLLLAKSSYRKDLAYVIYQGIINYLVQTSEFNYL